MPAAYYCPSRWLLAHHDPQANIYTMSSHMCLADLNNEGESLLALVDFKQSSTDASNRTDSTNQVKSQQGPMRDAPFDCRLRVYRGQQLIYNHFLDNMPSCLLATSIEGTSSSGGSGGRSVEQKTGNRALLTLTINDDVYFYHKLRPSHRLSLEDANCIMKTLNKSEYEVWQMVKQNKVDVETLRELLVGLSDELGCQELSSHSNNFLALTSNEEREKYILLWKFKPYIMSMDTICCAAARLKYTSTVTRSGDYGQTHETASPSSSHLSNVRWNKILDIQRDGLILGTEDRHLLIYDLRTTRALLKAHHRLPSTPDNILVERKSPASFDTNKDIKSLTYKILVSCRNCRIYAIDQNYLAEKDSFAEVKELIAIKSNVVDMCWSDDDENLKVEGVIQPNFVVACLDRKVYCFNSHRGHCRWVVETESLITCLISFPVPRVGFSDTQLIGVALKAQRIDFYISTIGRIVDSIYLNDGHCQAMTFGRFGREDNCLCITTDIGHLLIFILKRTAKFANAQCLSSAASYAANVLSRSTTTVTTPQQVDEEQIRTVAADSRKQLKLNEPAHLPSAFTLSRFSMKNPVDQAVDQLQLEHNCDQVLAKSTLDSHMVSPQLQIPPKSRDFVDQIVEQSRHSTGKQQQQQRQHCYRQRSLLSAAGVSTCLTAC